MVAAAGSKWPKTSIGCLRDGRRLTPEQLVTLCRICRCVDVLAAAHFQLAVGSVHAAGLFHASSSWMQTLVAQLSSRCTLLPWCSEESAAFQQQQAAIGNGAAAAAAAGSPAVAVNSACIALFECRSLERLLSCRHIDFPGGQRACKLFRDDVGDAAGYLDSMALAAELPGPLLLLPPLPLPLLLQPLACWGACSTAQ